MWPFEARRSRDNDCFFGNATQPLIRRVNLGKVLSAVSGADDPVTGTDVMAATGLTRATVHAVCNDLIRLGWVRELPARRESGNQLGRPSRWFEFNERAGYVLGVDIGPHSSTLLLADLRGTTLAMERVPVDDSEPASEHGRRVQQAAQRAAVAGLSRAHPYPRRCNGFRRPCRSLRANPIRGGSLPGDV